MARFSLNLVIIVWTLNPLQVWPRVGRRVLWWARGSSSLPAEGQLQSSSLSQSLAPTHRWKAQHCVWSCGLWSCSALQWGKSTSWSTSVIWMISIVNMSYRQDYVNVPGKSFESNCNRFYLAITFFFFFSSSGSIQKLSYVRFLYLLL